MLRYLTLFAITLVTALYFPSLASAGDVTGIFSGWVGKSKATLMETGGAPQKNYPDGSGGEIFVYEINTSATSPGVTYSNANLNARAYGNNVYGNVFGTEVYIPPQTTVDSTQLLFWISSAGTIYKITSNKEMSQLQRQITHAQNSQVFPEFIRYIGYNYYGVNKDKTFKSIKDSGTAWNRSTANSSYTPEEHGANSFEIGIARTLSTAYSQVGGYTNERLRFSYIFIDGPQIKEKFAIPGGTATSDIKGRFHVLMLGYAFHGQMKNEWYANFEGGIGYARGTAERNVTSGGTLSWSPDSEFYEYWDGFAAEINAGVTLKGDTGEQMLSAGVRYSYFPNFSYEDFSIKWRPVSFYVRYYF